MSEAPVTDVEPLIDSDEVAKILGVSRAWVMKAAKAGKIPHYRFASFTRFRESEIRAWLQERASA